jgi:hypothetical protein
MAAAALMDAAEQEHLVSMESPNSTLNRKIGTHASMRPTCVKQIGADPSGRRARGFRRRRRRADTATLCERIACVP